jgi:hypothetical protein
MEQKNYFFGWSKIKKGITELIKVYSNGESFFSKKRIESSIAFIVGQYGMLFFLITKMDILKTTDIVMWSAVEFGIAGYIVSQIQKEKKNDSTTPIE